MERAEQKNLILAQKAEAGLIQIIRAPSKDQLHGDHGPSNAETNGNFSGVHYVQSSLHEKSFLALYPVKRLSIDQVLLKTARASCERHKIEFAQLSTIQRKFVTHYRCNMCGLLPLYHINLLHAKRVRCRKCRQLISFKMTGKYGKLRKEIAFELAKEIQGGVVYAVQ